MSVRVRRGLFAEFVVVGEVEDVDNDDDRAAGGFRRATENGYTILVVSAWNLLRVFAVTAGSKVNSPTVMKRIK